jgi:hypothetical protein
MNNWNNYGYYNPAFMGAQNIPQTVSVPQPNLTPQVQSNAVNFKASEQIQPPQKEGLSKGAKWGIGLGATALAATGVYLATKGKVGGNRAQQLVKEFKPAKTIDEARAFANKKLNVQYIDEDKANLDMINTVNEWLYEEKIVANKKIPDFVNFCDKHIEHPLDLAYELRHNGKNYSALGINVNYIDKFDNLLEYVFKPKGEIDLGRLIKKNSENISEAVKPEYRCENLDKLIKKLNTYNKNSTFKDKMEIYDGIAEAIPYLNNILAGKNVKMSSFSDRGPFLHEIGHLIHKNTYKFFDEAGKESSKIYKEFQNKNIQAVALQVSAYAANSPLEFVAETYKRLRNGQVFSDDVMALYKKYNGPLLPGM